MTWRRAAARGEREADDDDDEEATSSSVEVSRATFGWKCITWPVHRSAPTMITPPSTSSAVAKSEPTIADCASALAGAQRADDDEELGEVAERRLKQPGRGRPDRSPTFSVAKETIHARSASASVASAKACSGAQCA